MRWRETDIFQPKISHHIIKKTTQAHLCEKSIDIFIRLIQLYNSVKSNDKHD